MYSVYNNKTLFTITMARVLKFEEFYIRNIYRHSVTVGRGNSMNGSFDGVANTMRTL